MNFKSAIKYLPYVVVEELLFRVGIASAIALWHREWALVISAVIFALFHWHPIKKWLRRWLGNWIGPTFTAEMVFACYPLGLFLGAIWLTPLNIGGWFIRLSLMVVIHWCVGWVGYELGIVQRWIKEK